MISAGMAFSWVKGSPGMACMRKKVSVTTRKREQAAIERNLMAQFARHFPALAPMVVARELSTPLTTFSFTGAQQGAVYGLEASPRRYLSESLRARTPVPGLFLTGQDVVTPGVTGAMMGGVLAASAIEPQVYPHIR